MVSKYQKQLEMVQNLGLAAAQQIIIDLSVAVQDKEYNLAGNFFYVKDSPDESSYIDVKVNGSNNQAVSWVKQTGFSQPFNRLYITTPAAQAGTMKILIAAEAPDLFDVIDNRSAISQNMTDVLAELRGDTTPENWGAEKTVGAAASKILDSNANRKRAQFQAKSTNAGIIYIGFDNTVTTTKWVAELLAGMAFSVDDYRGDIYAYASAAGQKLGWGEW